MTRPGRFQGLALSGFLALLVLAACIWWIYRDVQTVIYASKITGSISWTVEQNHVLLRRLAGFAAAVVAVHIAFGVLVWYLARLTRFAMPRLLADRMTVPIVAWTLILALLALAANATWFPSSRFAAETSWLLADWRGFAPLTWMLAVASTAVFALGVAALRRGIPAAALRGPAIVVVAVLAMTVGLPSLLGMARSESVAPADRPHIVIIGVDSLRNDLSEVSPAKELTPHIASFLRSSHQFSDAMSPLARTFPAWVSILTGRHPVDTNARFNLMPRPLVHEGNTLASALHAHGYQSVFATDEVRFANFDTTFGFDRTITPPIGASDFVIGAIGDLPLVNLLVGTRAGAWIFPALHANRAAHVTYRPEHFVSRLERELDVKQASFLAIHMTLAHWPYSWAGEPLPTTPQEFRPAYRHALETVDRQFSEVLDVLERKGVLRNALVVVLSDHGEALGFQSDSILRKTGRSGEIWDSLFGHGTSVLSPHQYSVVLAMRAFGRAKLPGPDGKYPWPTSLEDVRPTLEEYATGHAPSDVDGVSLLPFLDGRQHPVALDDRVRFTETCFNSIKMLEGKYSASGLVTENAIFYQMDPASGWVQLRPERLHEIMAKKQRAAVSKDAILAAIPSWTDSSVTWLYSPRREASPRRLDRRPDPREDPEGSRLMDALLGRFPGELSPPP